MPGIQNLFKLFQLRVLCQEPDQGVQYEDFLEDIETEEEYQIDQGSRNNIPTYSSLFHGVKSITMTIPRVHQIDGFRLSVGTAISPNFQLQHEFNLSPEQKQNQQQMMMGMAQPKTPFYQLTAQYHHGDLEKNQKVNFSLAGVLNSQGDLNAIFTKQIKNLIVWIQSQFMGGPERNITSTELIYKTKNSLQTVTHNSQASEYTIMQWLGQRSIIGCALNYIPQYRKVSSGYSLRFNRTPNDWYYLQYQGGIQDVISLGSIIWLDQNSSVAAELELIGSSLIPEANFGYRRKIKNFEIQNSFNTTGNVQTLCSYLHSQILKMKFFVSGNLFKEDFKSGFGFSVGSE